MILLELTEQELDTIAIAMAAERKLDRNLLFNDKERKDALCASVINKVKLARIKPNDELIEFKDFESMVSVAKQNYFRLDSQIFMSNKKVEENYFVYLCFVEAFTAWLNGKNLLKRLPKFDFTDKRW